VLSTPGCRTAVPDAEELASARDTYAARLSLALQRLGVFQLRGRASLDGSNLVAEGPYVVWADPQAPTVRADFYGPDGLPVVSLRCDSAGALVYLPGEGEAAYSPGGLPLGPAALPCRDLIALVRTGFPADLPQWVVSEGGQPLHRDVLWAFASGRDGEDTLRVRLRPGEDFPSLEHPEGSAEVTSTSPGDIYDAWPTSWHLSTADGEFDIAVSSIRSPQPPPASVWELHVPVPVDTSPPQPEWVPAWEIPAR
jgi:hypothetical protein